MPLRVIFRNLLAHPLRSLLTFGSVAVAVFLLCVLRAGVAGLTVAVEQAATTRLWVQSAVSLFVDLPIAYQGKIENVEGVEWVCKWQWFGGLYRDESGFFAQFAVDADTFLPSYPELDIIEGSYEAFQGNRVGCVIGEGLAQEYGWRVGDRVPLLGTIFPKADGSAWEFTVEAVYHSRKPSIDQKTMFFHYDYLRESLESGEGLGPPGVGVYLVQTAEGTDATPVMAAIDSMFENGPQRVQTTTEAEFSRQFVSMLGNVPALLSSIGGAVLFAVFFAVLNTMLMALRERMRDVGVLKALGFSDAAIFGAFTLESVVLCGAGGLTGLALAQASEASLVAALGGQLPGFQIGPDTLVLGLVTSLAVGILAGAAPAWAASRLTPVTALRAEA